MVSKREEKQHIIEALLAPIADRSVNTAFGTLVPMPTYRGAPYLQFRLRTVSGAPRYFEVRVKESM